MFGNALAEQMPGAEVEQIYREGNARQTKFVEQPQDPVEYWLVKAEGQQWLLPQPKDRQFRELDRCFEVEGGPVTPTRLESITPARLESEGDAHTLAEKGSVS